MEGRKIAILASLPEEIDVFNKVVKDYKWDKNHVILEVGGVGKAAAAAITQKVISEHKPDLILYTGVAGALSRELKLGDIGVVSTAIDAELDARPFNPKLKLGEFPFTGKRLFHTDPKILRLALQHPLNVNTFDAYVATTSSFMDGDRKQLFCDEIVPDLKAEIDGKERYPNLVDMESTGFLTAAEHNDVPALVIRSVSNTFEGDAPADLMKFLWDRVGEYINLVAYILTNIDKA